MNGCYLLNLDGTGYFSANTLCPEIIRKQDEKTKMNCERTAVKRIFLKLRQDHLHLKFIVNEDALSSKAPHIADLEEHSLHTAG